MLRRSGRALTLEMDHTSLSSAKEGKVKQFGVFRCQEALCVIKGGERLEARVGINIYDGVGVGRYKQVAKNWECKH